MADNDDDFREPRAVDPAAALSKAEGLSAYNPSWTDWVAQKLLGDSKPSTWWSNTVQNLTGSTGLGPTGYLSAKDFVPIAGQVLNAQQAWHEGKSIPEVGINLIPGSSVAGREALLAEQAAAKVAPKVVDGAVDLARRSLLALRPKAEVPAVTAPVTEEVANATPAELSFLNKPVSRRAVNEGLAGAGAAAVLGPTFAEDLLHSSLPRTAEHVVTPVVKSVMKSTPEVMTSKLTNILHRPLSVNDSILGKYLSPDEINNLPSPTNYTKSLVDEGSDFELGNLLGQNDLHYFASSDFKNPEKYNEVLERLNQAREDYSKQIRSELEKDLGHPVTDDEFKLVMNSAKTNHGTITDINRDFQSINTPELSVEAPFWDHLWSIEKKLKSDGSIYKINSIEDLQDAVRDNYTPEGLLKYVYGVPEKDVEKILSSPAIRDRLESIVEEAYSSGYIDDLDSYINFEGLKNTSQKKVDVKSDQLKEVSSRFERFNKEAQDKQRQTAEALEAWTSNKTPENYDRYLKTRDEAVRLNSILSDVRNEYRAAVDSYNRPYLKESELDVNPKLEDPNHKVNTKITELQSKIDELKPKLKQLDDAKYEATAKNPEEGKAAHAKWWEAQQEYINLTKKLAKEKKKSGQ